MDLDLDQRKITPSFSVRQQNPRVGFFIRNYSNCLNQAIFSDDKDDNNSNFNNNNCYSTNNIIYNKALPIARK